MVKNLFIFYLMAIIPPPLVVLLAKFHYFDSTLVVISIFLYGLVYLPILYSQRLSQLGIIDCTTYFKKIYLRRESKYLGVLFLGKKHF